jgi:hypothetical protein
MVVVRELRGFLAGKRPFLGVDKAVISRRNLDI